MNREKSAAKRFHEFLATVPELRDPTHESTFWGPHIKAFRLHEQPSEAEELATIVATSEFGFREKSTLRLLFDATVARFVNFIATRLYFLSDSKSKKYEHARALAFMQKKGLYADYLSFTQKFDIGSSMPSVRHYWYFLTLKKFLKPEETALLEIGSGAGNFAIFCLKELPVSTYVLIDLPQMLAYAAFQLRRFTPGVHIIYPNEFRGSIDTGNGKTVVMLTPSQIAMLPPASIDALFNFNSFSEMDREEIARYLKEIYRVGKKNALTYLVNRIKAMKDMQGVPYENNPYLFPYRADDEIFAMGLDEFHHFTRSGFNVIPAVTISRIARINTENTGE